MKQLRYSFLYEIVVTLLKKRCEGEYWDFKQEWHKNMKDLAKDIVCFANTVHDENCYLIFGINDQYEVTGMKDKRKK